MCVVVKKNKTLEKNILTIENIIKLPTMLT